MLNVGELQINSNFLLAPMSGVTDYPYREIVKKFKPGLVFSEMIASRALLAQNSKTMKMIKDPKAMARNRSQIGDSIKQAEKEKRMVIVWPVIVIKMLINYAKKNSKEKK